MIVRHDQRAMRPAATLPTPSTASTRPGQPLDALPRLRRPKSFTPSVPLRPGPVKTLRCGAVLIATGCSSTSTPMLRACGRCERDTLGSTPRQSSPWCTEDGRLRPSPRLSNRRGVLNRRQSSRTSMSTPRPPQSRLPARLRRCRSLRDQPGRNPFRRGFSRWNIAFASSSTGPPFMHDKSHTDRSRTPAAARRPHGGCFRHHTD